MSPFAALRAVRSGRANGLATLSPKGERAVVWLFSCFVWCCRLRVQMSQSRPFATITLPADRQPLSPSSRLPRA